MPSIRKYTKGSIIYFQGDLGEEIFVLQKGAVLLISTDPYKGPEGGEEREQVNLGEFFGVLSALGRYPHHETAQATTECSLVVFKLSEFEQYAVRNTRLIMKMIRVFSQQLRNVHGQVRNILNAGEEKNRAMALLNVAEAFYRNHQLEHAIYAFNRYLEYYPMGINRKRAQELLQMAKQSKTFPGNWPPPEPESSLENQERGHSSAKNAAANPHEANAGFSRDLPEEERRKRSLALSETYISAKNALSSNDHQTALRLFSQCANMTYALGVRESEMVQDSFYRKGIVGLKLGKLTNAAESFSQYIRNFPDGLELKNCFFQLGVITELKGDIEKARSFYLKAATMPPKDSITRQSRKRMEALA